MKLSTLALVALTLAFAAPAALAEDVYRWVDDEGVTHFTSQPPRERQSEQIQTRTGRSDPVDYSGRFSGNEGEEGREGDPSSDGGQASADEGPSEAQRRQACEQARRNLETLQDGGRILEEDDEGNPRYLNEQEISEREENARQVIDQAC